MGKILEHVEWPVLVFFASLFVMISGLEAAGVLEKVAQMVAQVSHISPISLNDYIISGLLLSTLRPLLPALQTYHPRHRQHK